MALLLAWPDVRGDWGDDLASVEQTFVDIVSHVYRCQRLIIACQDTEQCQRTARRLESSGIDMTAISLHACPYDGSWIRDYGPLTVQHEKTSSRRLVDFRFNGWGERFPAQCDDRLSARLYQQQAFADCDMQSVDFVLEGGAIDTDGAGTILSTYSCMDSRHPQLDVGDTSDMLSQYLGCSRLFLLRHGSLQGDETDGHIDMLARFVSTDTIVHASCRDRGHPDYMPLAMMADELRALRNMDGRPYCCIPLYSPHQPLSEGCASIPYSYVNFYIANSCVLVPQYGFVSEDKLACRSLRKCFPGRSIVGIDCSRLIRHGGGVHCVTMQLPCAPGHLSSPL